MNRKTYDEAKNALGTINSLLREGNLTDEEIRNFENLKMQLSGQLLSIWWPFDWDRRLVMISIFIVGLYGFVAGSYPFLFVWLLLPMFSPRIVGLSSYYIGRFAAEYERGKNS